MKDNIYVCDFETTTQNTQFWKNQIPQSHPYKENEVCKIPRVLLWAMRKINTTIDGWKETPKYFYNFIENTKANNSKQLKDIRGKRQEEAYNFNGYILGNSEKTFIDFLLNMKHNSIIYFHNLSYDGTYIIQMLKELKEYGFEQVHYESNGLDDFGIKLVGFEYSKNKKGIYKGNLKPFYWDVFRNGGELYKIDLCIKGVLNGNSRNITLTFICSANMLSSSVKSLGESLANNGEMFNGNLLQKWIDDESNIENKDSFYNVEPLFDKSVEEFYEKNKAFVEYCMRDVEIVARSLLNFEKVINNAPTIYEYNKNKALKNKRMSKNETKHNQYRTLMNENNDEICWIDISNFMTVAGFMRYLMEEIYIAKFQDENKEYDSYNVWRHLIKDEDIKHIKKALKFDKSKQKHQLPLYKTLAKVDYNDWKFIQGERLMLDEMDGSIKFCGLYRGGFTQFSTKYQILLLTTILNSGCKLDVSSAYPFQMTKPLPFGKLISQEDFEREAYYLKDENGKQIYINKVEGITYKEKCYSKIDGKYIDSIPIQVGGYKDLLKDKSKYYIIHTLYFEWIEAKTKEEDPSQFATKVPFLPSIDKDTYAQILLSDNNINDLYNSIEAQARYESKRQEKVIIQLWDFEWEFVKKYYNFKLLNQDVNCDEVMDYSNEIMYMLACPFLKTMSEELYAKKDEFAKEGDESSKLSTKIALNSSYGSLAIKPEFDSTYYIDRNHSIVIDNLLKEHRNIKDTSIREENLTISIIKNEDSSKINNTIIKGKSQSINTNYEAYKFKDIKENKKSPFNVFAASCITALQRVYLLETIEKIGVDYFAYSDTDSIIFCDFPIEVEKQIIDLINHKPHPTLNVGRWEDEIFKLEEFKVNKAKEYYQVFRYYDINKQQYYNIKKHKGYYDENGKWVKPRKEKIYCNKEEAIKQYKYASSGFKIPTSNDEQSKCVRALLNLTLIQRQKMSDEDFDEMFKSFSKEAWDEILNYNKTKEVFYDNLRKGYTTIPFANLQPLPYIEENGKKIYIVGGTLLGRKTKTTRYGKQ